MLGDFGIARALGETTRLTNPAGIIGTPAYMAPEQWVGEEIDGRADIYALGVVLYELLAGRPPFSAATPLGLMRQHLEVPVPPLAAHGVGVPWPFDEVLQRALAKDPAQRFQHAGDFKAAIDEAMLVRDRISPGSDTPSLVTGVVPPTVIPVGTGPPPANPSVVGTGDPTQPSMGWAGLPPTPAPKGPSVSPTSVIIALLAICVVILAGGMGYLLAGGRTTPTGQETAIPQPTTVAQAPTAAPTGAPAPTPLPPTVAPPPTQRSEAAAQALAPTATVPAKPAPESPPAPPPPTMAPVTPSDFWTVCVWCDQGTQDPRSEAERVAGQLRTASLPAAILWSTDYPSLNSGYWVTYSGTFDTERSANEHLSRVQAAGFLGRVRFVGRTQPSAQAPPTATRPSPTTLPKPTTGADPRLAVVERHVSDYFAALNADDYQRAQVACCTQRWRSQYPLDEWRKNFTGVTDLRFTTPFRYLTIQADRIVADVDYSFMSQGTRRNFTLRWTFVQSGTDWLADEAQARPQ